ncbi:hypothetical protein RFI_37609 [Reticulomyxa filosa]|uniref:Kelch motif family protein n=1 Tax=Reticulomyxa filosa TaxID=46433 RepID=X6LEA7_RETFI|nr:hypothetical protein RFI_37609 [Reticulomyxa filosa]|eukprot:ETN99858.1 hypothetical protein RFI_37609 [Reticulomyxa filosa]
MKYENGQGQEIMKINEENKKRSYKMLLFCFKTGLSIEYDEDNNTFQFHQLHVCDYIAPFNEYAYTCINNIILFFGGLNGNNVHSKSVHKYSIRGNKWMTFQNTLPSKLHHFAAILNEEDNDIHLIGGVDYKKTILSTHMKTKVSLWYPSHLSRNEIKFIIQYWIRTLQIKFGWIYDFDNIIMKYSRMQEIDK